MFPLIPFFHTFGVGLHKGVADEPWKEDNPKKPFPELCEIQRTRPANQTA